MEQARRRADGTRPPAPRRRGAGGARAGRGLGPLLALAALIGAPGAGAQDLDICGCEGSPESLGAFHSRDSSTWPPGTVVRNDVFGGCHDAIDIPLPPDGVLVFDSIVLDNTPRGCNAWLRFVRNGANTPVTLLVSGDVILTSRDGIHLDAAAGTHGTGGAAGVGGQGGPGGFAGGDGAYQLGNLAADGGTGVGPGGGRGGRAEGAAPANGGVFFGVPELRPLVGGSGGGGGHSTGGAGNCAAGGGGGGGGALLLAVNGTLDIRSGSTIRANGGPGGSPVNGGCASGGGGGSGGAIRLVARRITGSGRVEARGGAAGCCSPANNGLPGRIRMEALENTFASNNADPVALRVPAPGPLVDPITPTVRITAIDGVATPAEPRGHRGQIDLVVAAPGVVQIDLETTDIPAGTEVEVAVKPKLGDPPLLQRVALDAAACSAGICVASVAADLAPGAYIVEARATFEVP